MTRKNIRYFLFYSIFLTLSSWTRLFAEPPQSGPVRIRFINTALDYVGTPYRYGGRTKKGMDCSGLVYRCAVEVLGVKLPRRSDLMADYAQQIPENAIQPGDLLFFNTAGRISHTGIYIGAGKFVHSASDGPQTGVIISSIQEIYWKKAFRRAGRIMPEENIFTGEAMIPLFLRTEENSTLHPEIRFSALQDEKTAVTPLTGTKESVFARSYGLRIGILYGLLWDWNLSEDIFRGIASHIELAWAHRRITPGVTAGLYWDQRTGSVSSPVAFYLEFFEQLRIYAGYQHHFFVHADLAAKAVFPVIAGIAWHSLPFRAGMQRIRLFQAVEYTYIKNIPLEKSIRFLTGISFNFYKEIS